MLWDYGRLAANSDRDNAARALRALLTDQPGRLDVRLVLAFIQVSGDHAKETLETLNPVKSVTREDAPRLVRSEPVNPSEVEQMPQGQKELPSITGNFVELDCSESPPKLILETGSGKVALLLDQPNNVAIKGPKAGMVDMNCGAQKPARVTAGYLPLDASKDDVKGRVRSITFEADAN